MILGILDADNLRKGLKDTYVSYAQMMIKLFEQVPSDVRFRSYSVRNGEYPDTLDDCDSYLITGSKSSAYDDDNWISDLKIFIQKCYQSEKRLLGICFGHQLIAEALGGKTELASSGWGVGVHRYKVDSEFQGEFSCLSDEFSLLVSHRDQVTQLPTHAKNLATSEFCPHAAYFIKNKVLCFQGHPEFTTDYAKTLMDIRQEDIGLEKYTMGQQSLGEHTEHLEVAKALLDFVS